MKIPKTFSLGGTVWTVKEVPNLAELGLCYRDEALICIRKGLSAQVKLGSFCHELVHAIKYTQGDGGPHDEKEVDAFANLLHQFLITKQ